MGQGKYMWNPRFTGVSLGALMLNDDDEKQATAATTA